MWTGGSDQRKKVKWAGIPDAREDDEDEPRRKPKKNRKKKKKPRPVPANDAADEI